MENIKKKVNTKNTLLYLNFFGLIYINGSLWAIDGISGTIHYIAKIILVSVAIFINGICLKKTHIELLIVLTVLVLITVISSGLYFDLDIGALLNLFFATAIVSVFDEKTFQKYYCKVMYHLCIFSLIGFVAYYLARPLLSFFPSVTWHSNITFANLIVTLVPLSMNDYVRNWGIFREPGYFSVFIVIALLFELFYKKEKNEKAIIIYALSLITTFSTTGLCALLMLICGYFCSRNINKVDAKTKKKMLVLFTIIAVAMVSWLLCTSSGRLMFKRIFGKIFFEKEINASYLNRTTGIAWALEIIKNRPLTGGGYISFIGKEVDFTELQWFAVYGFFFGLICNFLYLSYPFKLKQNAVCKIFLMGTLFVIACSQSIETSMLTFIIIQYSIKKFIYKQYKRDTPVEIEI